MKKTKFTNLRMEFNPGTQKYEPVLPLRKIKEKIEKRIGLIDWIILIIIMLAIIGFAVYRLSILK